VRFTKESIQQGRQNQRATEEVAEFIPTLDGAPQYRPTRKIDVQNQRMAGQVGARALAMMTNPEEIKRTNNYMDMVKRSPLRSVQETLMPPPMVG
jgi:hypothetical protein